MRLCLSYCAAILLIGCLSCSKSQDDLAPNRDGAIQFAASISPDPSTAYSHRMDLTTRGTSVIGTALPTSETFGVLGYTCSSGSWVGTETPASMYNIRMTAAGNYYDQATTHYWNQASMRFFAYYPYTDQSLSGRAIQLSGSNEAGVPYIDYTCPRDPSAQIDLLAASTNALNKQATVPLTFRHLLTKILLKGKTSEVASKAVTIKRIQLCNIRLSGRYHFETGWSFSIGSTRDTLTLFEGDLPIGVSPREITSDAESALLIPQDLSIVKIMTTYHVEDTEFVRTLSLFGSSAWTGGKALTYELSVSPTNGSGTLWVVPVDWDKVSIRLPLQ